MGMRKRMTGDEEEEEEEEEEDDDDDDDESETTFDTEFLNVALNANDNDCCQSSNYEDLIGIRLEPVLAPPTAITTTDLSMIDREVNLVQLNSNQHKEVNQCQTNHLIVPDNDDEEEEENNNGGGEESQMNQFNFNANSKREEVCLNNESENEENYHNVGEEEEEEEEEEVFLDTFGVTSNFLA
jgi:hypothetical protein